GGELDPVGQDEIEELAGDPLFGVQPPAVDRAQALEKCGVGRRTPREIVWPLRPEPVVVRALTFVARRQRVLLPREGLLLGEEVGKGLARRPRARHVSSPVSKSQLRESNRRVY